MIYRKSHNDYWNKKQIIMALAAQCCIIECDVIPYKKQFLLSHSWRPFKCLMYGKLDKYLKFAYNWTINDRLMIQIDIKFSDRTLAPYLALKILEYKTDNVTILLSANNRWYTGDREGVMKDVHSILKSFHVNVELYSVFKERNTVKSIDLYKKQPWYKKINHF